MRDKIVKLYPNNAAENADNVLEQALGVYDEVFIIGYDKDGEIDIRSSTNFSTESIFYLLEIFKHRLLRGDYYV